MKIRNDISEAFQVKNKKKGLKKLKQIKALFKGSDFKVVVRGRNKNRRKAVEKAGLKYGAQHRQDIPIKLASRLAVYIISKSTGKHLKFTKTLTHGS